MHRFYIPAEIQTGSEIFLRGGEAHHAANVLRIRDGERVVVLDGRGTELMCTVILSRRMKSVLL